MSGDFNNLSQPVVHSTDYTIGNLHAKVDVLLERTQGFDGRLRTVEKRQWVSIGASAILATIATKITLAGWTLGLH